MRRIFATSAIIAVAIELLIFNMSTWFSLGNQKEVVTETYSVEGATLNPDSGTYTINDAQVVLYAGGIVKDVSDIYWGIDFEDEIVSYSMRISDEGNTAISYETTTQYILQWSDASKYIRIHPYGKVLTNKVIFNVTPGKTMRINEIAYNPVRALRIRPLRLGVLFLILFGFGLFSKKSKLHEIPMEDNQDKPMVKRIKIGVEVAYVIFGIIGILILNIKCGGYWSEFAYMSEYADLAESMSRGHYYLDYEVSDALREAENPYDYTYRDVNMIESSWDTAYFDGKYYCYFGVTPVLTLYLPYRVITGKDLNNVIAALIFSILTWIGATWFSRELIHRYFEKAPYWLWFAMSFIFGFNVQLTYLYQRPDMYDIPILAGNAFAFLGLASWLKSLRCKYTKTFMVIGSICLALLAGCRPQMLVIAFLAIPIFYEMLIQKSGYRFANWKKYGLAILLPFVIFAVFIMHYNYARFGSVFDFGANYNLTTNDMTRRGFHIDRLGSGVFSFLLQLPSTLSIFPFMIRSNVATEYMGKTIAENVYGGIFATNIIFSFVVLIGYMKKRLESKKAGLLVISGAILGVIVCCVDATVAGVLQRYMGDFVILLGIPGVVIFGILLSEFWQEKRNLYYIMAMLCWGAILFTCLMDMSVVSIQLREYNADNRTLILYHELRSYFVLQ